MLAITLTASPESWHATGWKRELSDASKTIILSSEKNWDVLDFEGIEFERKRGRILLGLADRLTDNNIAALIVCIDAKNRLKKLRLMTYLCKLDGHCLEPLRGSLVLKEIDAHDICV